MANKAILVAGMHRSGTSLLTAILGHLGCDLPKDTMQADEHNPFGYGESNKIRRVNDEMLESAGSSWDDCAPFNHDWQFSPQAEELLAKLARVVRSEFASSPLYVVKDPRICRMMPIWLDTLRSGGSEPHVILQVRDPIEVAHSLRSRDGMDPAVGMILWLRHVLDAEKATRGCERIVVHLDDLLADWTRVAAAIALRFGIRWPSESPGTRQRIDNEIRHEALHHRTSEGGARHNQGVSWWVKSVYEVVVGAANGDVSNDGRRELDRINGLFDQSMDLFGRAMAVERGLRERLVGATQRVDHLDRIRLDHETQLEEASTAQAALHERLREVGARLANSDRWIDSLMHTVANRDGTIGDLQAKLSAAGAEAAGHVRSMRELGTEVDATRSEIAKRASRIETLEDRLKKTQQIARDHERSNHALNEKLAAAEANNRLLEGRLTDRSERLRELARQVSDQETLERARAELARRVATQDASLLEASASLAKLRTQLEEAKTQHDTDKRANEETASRDRAVIGELRDRLRNADDEAASANGEIRRLRSVAEDLDGQVAALLRSTSWRVTLPMRAVKTGISSTSSASRRLVYSIVGAVGRTIWRTLPLPEPVRTRLRARLGWVRGRIDNASRAAPRYVAAERAELTEICNRRSVDPNSEVPILFDEKYYLQDNDDIREAGIDPFEHYLNHGAIEGRLPFEVSPESLDRDIVALHRLDLADDEAFAFDPTFYASLYEDLSGMSAGGRREHYEEMGRQELRHGSKGDFVRSFADNPREIPIDFNAHEYVDLYPDLAVYARRPLAALEHYMRHGRWEPRLYTLKWRSFGTADEGRPLASNPGAGSKQRLCVLVHVFYHDLWPELAKYLANIDWRIGDLYVNLVDATFDPSIVGDIRSRFPFARVYVSENRGRDVGGHVSLLRHLVITDYAAFLLLHTKKSPHMSPGEAQLWRNKLLVPIVGTKQRASASFERFVTDASIGAIGSKSCRYTEMNENETKVVQLMDRLGAARQSAQMEFVTGTMLFLRAGVVDRLFELVRDLDYQSPDELSGGLPRDGQWEHAVERFIGVVVHHMGLRFEWV